MRTFNPTRGSIAAGLVLCLAATSLAHAADPAPAPAPGPAPAAANSGPVDACLAYDGSSRDPARLIDTISACTTALGDKSLETDMRAQMLHVRGVAEQHAGLLPQALADLQAARTLSPKDANIVRMLAWTYREMGQVKQAEAEYDRALELDPHWQAYLSRCVVRLDTSEFRGALADCQAASRLSSNEDIVYFTGLAHARLADYAAAVLALEPALDGPYSSPRLYELLASVHLTAGRKADAERVLAQGRGKFPKSPDLATPKSLQ